MLKQAIIDTPLANDQLAFFYLGQEGFLIKFRKSYFLIDPYLSDYVDRHCCTDTVHWKRRYQPPILAKELDFELQKISRFLVFIE